MRTFNAHHSPIGAYAAFTLGVRGRGGGLSSDSGHPPLQDVFAGIQAPDGAFEALPFYAAAVGAALRELSPEEVERSFGATVDAFTARGLTLRINSPLRPVPEPGVAPDAALRDALLPAVLAEVVVDNRTGDTARRAFLGFGAGAHPLTVRAGDAPVALTADRGEGRLAGMWCLDAARAVAGPDIGHVLAGPGGAEGRVGALLFDAPPGAVTTYRIVIAFWHDGPVMTGAGVTCRLWANRLFGGIDDVVAYARAHFDRLAAEHAADGAAIDAAPLSDDQRFQLAHATRSYLANTALVEDDRGRPLWLVMEGEFEYVATLDLVVDHAFFELARNPWTVRATLDLFRARGAFRDDLGLRFTHDLGCFPAFAEVGRSSYEHRLNMAVEELANWALTALLYIHQTGDEAWADANAQVLADCFDSLVAREAGRRGDEEITTYDGLDRSLMQARGSTYLAGKEWAVHVCLAAFFAARGDATRATAAEAQAGRIAGAVTAAAGPDGALPALLGTEGHEAHALTIPAVEGLVYPLFAGAPRAVDRDGPYAEYVAALDRHLDLALAPGACRLTHGGWRLSSSHDAAWLSKLFIAQFIARRILGRAWDEDGRRADAVHVRWLLHPDLSRYAWCDQFVAGVVVASRWYPRGVTAALWLEEDPQTARLSTAARR